MENSSPPPSASDDSAQGWWLLGMHLLATSSWSLAEHSIVALRSLSCLPWYGASATDALSIVFFVTMVPFFVARFTDRVRDGLPTWIVSFLARSSVFSYAATAFCWVATYSLVLSVVGDNLVAIFYACLCIFYASYAYSDDRRFEAAPLPRLETRSGFLEQGPVRLLLAAIGSAAGVYVLGRLIKKLVEYLRKLRARHADDHATISALVDDVSETRESGSQLLLLLDWAITAFLVVCGGLGMGGYNTMPLARTIVGSIRVSLGNLLRSQRDTSVPSLINGRLLDLTRAASAYNSSTVLTRWYRSSVLKAQSKLFYDSLRIESSRPPASLANPMVASSSIGASYVPPIMVPFEDFWKACWTTPVFCDFTLDDSAASLTTNSNKFATLCFPKGKPMSSGLSSSSWILALSMEPQFGIASIAQTIAADNPGIVCIIFGAVLYCLGVATARVLPDWYASFCDLYRGRETWNVDSDESVLEKRRGYWYDSDRSTPAWDRADVLANKKSDAEALDFNLINRLGGPREALLRKAGKNKLYRLQQKGKDSTRESPFVFCQPDFSRCDSARESLLPNQPVVSHSLPTTFVISGRDVPPGTGSILIVESRPLVLTATHVVPKMGLTYNATLNGVDYPISPIAKSGEVTLCAFLASTPPAFKPCKLASEPTPVTKPVVMKALDSIATGHVLSNYEETPRGFGALTVYSVSSVPGNSGSPVLDARPGNGNRLVGVHSGEHESGSSNEYAGIHSRYTSLVDQVKTYFSSKSNKKPVASSSSPPAAETPFFSVSPPGLSEGPTLFGGPCADRESSGSHRLPFVHMVPHRTGTSDLVPEGVPIVGFSFQVPATHYYDYGDVLSRCKPRLQDGQLADLVTSVYPSSGNMLWVRPTVLGVRNALTKRFSAPSSALTYDPVLLEVAIRCLLADLPMSKYMEAVDLKITKDGSSGIGYECCSTKLKCVVNHKPHWQSYLKDPRSHPAPLFKYMTKVESLPATKVKNDDLRPIIFPPFHFYLLQLCYTQDLDSKLKAGCHPFVFVGRNPLGPDFNTLAHKLDTFAYKFKGDITKFDASFKRSCFELVYRIRSTLLSGGDPGILDFVCSVLHTHHVVLPDGTVIMDYSETSGQACTTTDNCLLHLIVVYYMICSRLRQLNMTITPDSIRSFAHYSIYSDDHVAATNDAVFASFEFRSSIYAQFNLTLKKIDDLVTTNVTDLTFLGGRFKAYEDKFVYYYDDNELVSSWMVNASGRWPSENANAILSTIQLRCSDKDHYLIWSGIFNAYCALHSGKPLPHKGVAPSWFHFLYSQLGFESYPPPSVLPRFMPALSSDLEPDPLSSCFWGGKVQASIGPDVVIKQHDAGHETSVHVVHSTSLDSSSMSGVFIPGRARGPAKSILTRLIANRDVTQDGVNWLVTATDPFHDDAIHLAGYPDMTQARSVVQCVTQTRSISAPSGLSGQNWDAHVVFVPMALDPGGSGYGYTPGVNPDVPPTTTGASVASLFGGYQIITGPSGFDSTVGSGSNWTAATGTSLCCPAVYTQSNCRMIAAGYEVVNTTAILNKQGSVTSYRMPGTVTPVLGSALVTPAVGTATSYNIVQMWPGTQVNAQVYPGSVTWDAAEGVYAVASLNRSDVPISHSTPTALYIVPQPGVSSTQNVWSSIQSAGNAPPSSFVLPFDVHGSVFSNLSPSSTLQVTTRYYVEKFPTHFDASIVTLSDPSAPYDPLILEIAGRAMGEMPVAVMVKENPLGEWFSKVLGGIKSTILPAGIGLVKSVFPGAAPLINAAQSAISAMSNPNALASQVANQLQEATANIRSGRKNQKAANKVARMQKSQNKKQQASSSTALILHPTKSNRRKR